VYHADGEVKERLMEEIRDAIGPGRRFLEALGKKRPMWLIKHFGSDVTLGNIAPDKLLSVVAV